MLSCTTAFIPLITCGDVMRKLQEENEKKAAEEKNKAAPQVN
jgi:hypothetical protein